MPVFRNVNFESALRPDVSTRGGFFLGPNFQPAGKMRKKQAPQPPNLPDPGDLPEAACKNENWISCIGCPPGQGKMIWIDETCHTIEHPCEDQSKCPSGGPIDIAPEGLTT